MSQVAAPSMASPTAASAAPAEPAPKQPQFDSSELSRLQAENAQLQREVANGKGWKSYAEKANKYGISKPEDFDRLGPVVQHFQKNKIDPNAFLSAFGQAKQEDPEGSPELTIARVQEMIGGKLSEAKKEWIREQAEKEDGVLIASDLESLSRESISGELGEVPDQFKDLAYYAGVGKWLESRKQYEEGHPLAGRMGAAGKDGVAGIRKFLKESTEAIRTSFRASQAAQIGDAARKRTTTPTPAGSTPGQGAPTKPNPGDPTDRRAKLQALADAQLAKKR